MKTDQGTRMEEEPGQCEGGGEMYMPKATWWLVSGTSRTGSMASDSMVFLRVQ